MQNDNNIIDIPPQQAPKQEVPICDVITKEQAAKEVIFVFKKLNFSSLVLFIAPIFCAGLYRINTIIGSFAILISCGIGGYLFYRSKKEIERLSLKYKLEKEGFSLWKK